MNNSLLLLIAAAIQIIGEVLPISSSGHVAVATEMFRQWGGYVVPALPEEIDYLMHGPMILIVMFYFRRSWLGLFKITVNGLWHLSQKRAWADLTCSQRRVMHKVFVMTGMVFIAGFMTEGGLLLAKVVRAHTTMLDSMPMLLCGFCLTTLLLGLTEKRIMTALAYRGQLHPFTIAFVLGLVQSLAFLPGVSRFASTMVCAQLLGLKPTRSIMLSFMLFFPLMIAAFLVHGIGGVLHAGNGLTLLSPAWLAMYMGAGIVAYALFAAINYLNERRLLYLISFYMILPITIGFLLWYANQ